MLNTILKECSMQYGSKMPDCKLWHFQQYLFCVRRCPAGANRCKFLRNPVRVKSALKMCSPTPPIFNWKLYCGFIQCNFLLTCANFLPYWCILVQIFYRTGAPCRDQWRTLQSGQAVHTVPILLKYIQHFQTSTPVILYTMAHDVKWWQKNPVFSTSPIYPMVRYF